MQSRSATRKAVYDEREGYLMKKSELQKIGVGFYQDDRGSVYFDMQEFLTFHSLPDRPETRAAVWSEINRQFGVNLAELLDE